MNPPKNGRPPEPEVGLAYSDISIELPDLGALDLLPCAAKGGKLRIKCELVIGAADFGAILAGAAANRITFSDALNHCVQVGQHPWSWANSDYSLTRVEGA